MFDSLPLSLTCSAQRPEDDDAEMLTYPREKLGNIYAVNWALNRYSVTPTGAAYHNLPAESLMARSRGAMSALETFLVLRSC